MSNENILNQRWTFFTAAGTFTGTVKSVDEVRTGYSYGLEDIIFRPAGDFRTQILIPECAVYSSHIISSTVAIEPVKFESVGDQS